MASGRTGTRGVGEHAERERVPFVHASLAHHRGRHRQGEMFLKPGKGRARRREVHGRQPATITGLRLESRRSATPRTASRGGMTGSSG